MKVKVPRGIFAKFLESKLRIVIGDANFFIPITRGDKQFPFKTHKEKLVEPFLEFCDLVYVHTSVINEIVDDDIQDYVKNHQKVVIVDESKLNKMERISFRTIEDAVANYTNYNPNNGCYDDKGEVKSISYAAVNDVDFFITHDGTAIKILENSDLHKFSRDVRAITLYEIIYLLTKMNGDKDVLKKMYKFMFYSKKSEKLENPSWSDFVSLCDENYGDLCDSFKK